MSSATRSHDTWRSCVCRAATQSDSSPGSGRRRSSYNCYECGEGSQSRDAGRAVCDGNTRDQAISNTERLAIEVTADRIAHGELLSSSLGVSFTIPDEQLASETPAWLSSAAHSSGLAGLRVHVPRPGRDRTPDVGEGRQADRVECGPTSVSNARYTAKWVRSGHDGVLGSLTQTTFRASANAATSPTASGPHAGGGTA